MRYMIIQIRYERGTIIGKEDNFSVIIKNNIRKRITPKFSSLLKLRWLDNRVNWISSNYDLGKLLWKLEIPEK